MEMSKIVSKLIGKDTAMNIVKTIHLDKNIVTNQLTTLIIMSLSALRRVEGGIEFLNKYLCFRGLDVQSCIIFIFLIAKGLLIKEVGKIILIDFFKLNPEERKEEYPENTGTIIPDNILENLREEGKYVYTKLFSFLLSLDNSKEAICMYSLAIKNMFDLNYLNTGDMVLIQNQFVSFSEIPVAIKYTIAWILSSVKLTIEHLDILFSGVSIYEGDRIIYIHSLIINHPGFDPNDYDLMCKYLLELEEKFIINKSDLDKVVSHIYVGMLRNRIILKFYLYMLYPEKYLDYDAKYKLSQLSSQYFDRVVSYFCDHLPENRAELQRYDWFATHIIIRLLDSSSIHFSVNGWEILGILIPKYKTILKLRDLVTRLIKGHACRECEGKLVKLYGYAVAIQS